LVFFLRINWSEIPSPISTNLLEKFIHQSIHTPIQYLGINETVWSQCRTFALNLSKQGFVDPISILYTSFKHISSFNITLNIFTRWLLLNELNKIDFPLNSLRYPIFQTANDLLKCYPTNKQINFLNPLTNIDQIWFLFSISLLLPTHSHTLTPDTIILDNNATRLSLIHKRSTASRLHCLFAVTPSGKYSNQLIICKPGRNLKVNFSSNLFTRIMETDNEDILYKHIKQWLDDFLSLSYPTKNR
jgi:hypothetical protein